MKHKIALLMIVIGLLSLFLASRDFNDHMVETATKYYYDKEIDCVLLIRPDNNRIDNYKDVLDDLIGQLDKYKLNVYTAPWESSLDNKYTVLYHANTDLYTSKIYLENGKNIAESNEQSFSNYSKDKDTRIFTMLYDGLISVRPIDVEDKDFDLYTYYYIDGIEDPSELAEKVKLISAFLNEKYGNISEAEITMPSIYRYLDDENQNNNNTNIFYCFAVGTKNSGS